MPDHYKSPPKKKKRRGSVNPLGKPRGDVYRDTRRPDSPKKGAQGQADVPTAKQKEAVASIAAFAGGAAGKSLMTATRGAMRARAAKIAKRDEAWKNMVTDWRKIAREKGHID
tara:strand:- start:707 stop:1045 length:339 start_codon:yes stop_codon:yes gene_type:complete